MRKLMFVLCGSFLLSSFAPAVVHAMNGEDEEQKKTREADENQKKIKEEEDQKKIEEAEKKCKKDAEYKTSLSKSRANFSND